MEPVFVPKTPHDKALQRALMQWRKPQNRKLVLEALHKTGREDLDRLRQALPHPPRQGTGPRRPPPGGTQRAPGEEARPGPQQKGAGGSPEGAVQRPPLRGEAGADRPACP